MNDLRDAPTSSGRPPNFDLITSRLRNASRLCDAFLAKPIPGSAMIRDLSTPPACALSIAPARSETISPITSLYSCARPNVTDHDRCTVFGYSGCHFSIGQHRNVVRHAGTGIESGVRDRRFTCVDAYRDGASLRELRNHGQDTFHLFVGRYRPCVRVNRCRSRRLASDVNDVGTVVFHT